MANKFLLSLPDDLRLKVQEIANERKCSLTQVIKDAIIYYASVLPYKRQK